MKKLWILFASLFLVAQINAQPVPRQQVVLEIGTGTWCPYCPGAAMGADDLIANGCDVAVIEYHSGDPFTTTSGTARINYYSITGFPTAWFDGTLNSVGGSNTTSMYSTYLPLYNQCIAIASDFSVDIYGENTGLTYNVVIEVENVNANTNPDLVVHVVLTESEIVYSWQGQSELNYVERLMAPNAAGTPISFAGGATQQVNVSFTLDPSWNTNHLELVAFVQDASTKSVKQSEKIDILNLQPFQATAMFSSNNTQPCVNTSVDFTDNSLGNVVSWNWYFEGATPSTSTLQNPTVSYSTTGTFDVQLIVSDGTVIDTNYQADYIHVIDIPVQADLPAGPENICQGDQGIVYTTASVPEATAYSWSLYPSTAGTITGNGTSATLDLSNAYLGNIQIKVRAENTCGDGSWSPELTVSVNSVPEAFTLMGSGGYCEGEPGVELILSGSETGVNYELYLDGDPTGQVLPGTGSSISFGFQTSQGIYTCTGYTDYCTNDMIGNSYIFAQSPPGLAGIPVGPGIVCNNGDTTSYVTSGASNAEWYDWELSPQEAGVINSLEQEAWVTWSDGWTGQAAINVTGTNDCGSGPTSSDLLVDVYPVPSPEIAGEPLVCDYEPGVLYSTEDHPGSFYSWEVTGGAITAGSGTHEIMVTWGEPGMGSVTVMEEDANGCNTVTEAFEVVIDDCTEIEEQTPGAIRLYPNPVRDQATLEFRLMEKSGVTLRIVNSMGQVVYQEEFLLIEGQQKMNLMTGALTEGYYRVSIMTDKGLVSGFNFTKIR